MKHEIISLVAASTGCGPYECSGPITGKCTWASYFKEESQRKDLTKESVKRLLNKASDVEEYCAEKDQLHPWVKALQDKLDKMK